MSREKPGTLGYMLEQDAQSVIGETFEDRHVFKDYIVLGIANKKFLRVHYRVLSIRYSNNSQNINSFLFRHRKDPWKGDTRSAIPSEAAAAVYA